MIAELSEHWQHFVQEKVQSGRFPSEAAVLEEALALLEQRDHPQSQPRPENETGTRSIGEIIDELMSDVPGEVLDRLPVEGAAQHDHYIYGTPRRLS